MDVHRVGKRLMRRLEMFDRVRDGDFGWLLAGDNIFPSLVLQP
jgi:hypothetical protein